MNRAIRVTLILLAVVAVSFAATWATLPGSHAAADFPASLYASGLTKQDPGGTNCIRWSRPYEHEFGTTYRDCIEYSPGPEYVADTGTLRRRVYGVHGGAAAAIVLFGLALGAGRRKDAVS